MRFDKLTHELEHKKSRIQIERDEVQSKLRELDQRDVHLCACLVTLDDVIETSKRYEADSDEAEK